MINMQKREIFAGKKSRKKFIGMIEGFEYHSV